MLDKAAASTDEELLNATTSDRTLRLVPRSFEEYRHPERLGLARAVLEAMQAKDQEAVAAPDPPPRAREGAAGGLLSQPPRIPKIVYETHND